MSNPNNNEVNPKFRRGNPKLNKWMLLDVTAQAYKDGKADGRAEYEKESEELFNENPPMHFSTVQLMWLKERIKLSYLLGKTEGIEMMANVMHKEFVSEDDMHKIIDEKAEELKKN